MGAIAVGVSNVGGRWRLQTEQGKAIVLGLVFVVGCDRLRVKVLRKWVRSLLG